LVIPNSKLSVNSTVWENPKLTNSKTLAKKVKSFFIL